MKLHNTFKAFWSTKCSRENQKIHLHMYFKIISVNYANFSFKTFFFEEYLKAQSYGQNLPFQIYLIYAWTNTQYS
jgi:hypothetical protein